MSRRQELITEYFKRQYDSKEGTAAENVERLFKPDLVFHLSGTKTMGRSDLVALCDLLRRTRHDRTAMVRDFEEEGDMVSFVLYVLGTDPQTGHDVAVSTRTHYRFEGDMVAEVWQDESQDIEGAVRAAGVDLRRRDGRGPDGDNRLQK